MSRRGYLGSLRPGSRPVSAAMALTRIPLRLPERAGMREDLYWDLPHPTSLPRNGGEGTVVSAASRTAACRRREGRLREARDTGSSG